MESRPRDAIGSTGHTIGGAVERKLATVDQSAPPSLRMLAPRAVAFREGPRSVAQRTKVYVLLISAAEISATDTMTLEENVKEKIGICITRGWRISTTLEAGTRWRRT